MTRLVLPLAIYFSSVASFAYSPSHWRADYLQLRKQIANSYANLEWIQENRKINLPELNRLTLQRLDHAKTDAEAFKVLVQFVSAFGDGHLTFDPKTFEKFAPVTEYPFEVREENKKFYLSKMNSPNCALVIGDEVVKIDGRSIADRVEENKEFLSESNPITKNQRALRRLRKSPFLPTNQQTVEGLHDGKVISCEVKPLPFKSLIPKDNAPPTKTMTAEVACKHMGFENDNHDFKFNLGEAKILSAKESAFPIALLTTSKGKKIGLVRISSFVREEFENLCLVEWDKFKKNCEQDCRQQFLEKQIEPALVAELKDTVEKLKDQKPSAIVIDLTFNGGGSSWGDAAAALFAKKPFVCDTFGLIRHPKWTAELSKQKEKLEEVLNNKNLSSLQKTIAAKELAHVRKLMAETEIKCDRDSIWDAKKSAPTCQLLIKDPNPLCGDDDELLDQALDGIRVETRPQNPHRGIYDGPLYVLTNAFSASQSEAFTKLLKESDSAKVIGETTMGIGCGFSTEAKPIPLKYSRVELEIPDCQRFFKNGDSELLGIKPDIPLDMSHLDDAGFVRSLLKAVE
jgi:hypothetical protein